MTNENNNKKKIVVVVDPLTTGALLAQSLMDRGYSCICVYSYSLEIMEMYAANSASGNLRIARRFAATIGHEGDINETVSAIQKAAKNIHIELGQQPREEDRLIEAVFPGAEVGVRLADAIINALGLRGNIFEHSAARRNKYLMAETIRKQNIRAVKQYTASSWDQVEEFIQNELKPNPFQVILKPVESAGTEDVALCHDLNQAKKAFETIFGKINSLGIENNAVLVQEYLDGDEYSIDTVSRDGKHKVMLITKYDKRPANGAPFVYFSSTFQPAVGIINDLIAYLYKVLDALGIRNGAAHAELKFCRGSPVLIEVNSRCQGGEGDWILLANKCIGYNQVEASIDAILNPHEFNKLPERPLTLHLNACICMLVSYQEGKLKSLPGLQEIEKFSSFSNTVMVVVPGEIIRRTVDVYTTPGSILLAHKDIKVMEKDLKRIRELESNGLFDIHPEGQEEGHEELRSFL